MIDGPARPVARRYAAVVVALRHVIPVAWVAAVVAATISLPALGDAPAAPIDDLAATGGPAQSAQALATRTFGFPLTTDTAVVQRDPRGLSRAAQQRQVAAARAVLDHRVPGIRAAIPISNAAVRSPSGEQGTTALTYLAFPPGSSVDDQNSAAHRYARSALGGPAASVVGVTGSGPAREEQFHEIEDALPMIEAASVALIAIIVALAFRSLGAPLVALSAAGVSYGLATRVLPWLGERANVTVPQEIEPIVVVLLLGLVTDYSIFFLSETRRRLGAGEERLPAARDAVTQVAPMVFTAGLIVAAGTAALVAGRLEFFRAFGPGLAATTLVTLAVSITLVPALVALFGPRLFGARLRREAAQATDAPEPVREMARSGAEHDGLRGRVEGALAAPRTALARTETLAREHQTARWRLLVARVASSRPVALVIAALTIGVLVVAALGMRSTKLGMDFVHALPADSEARQAAEAAGRGFAPGIVAPTEVDVVAPDVASRKTQLVRLQSLIAREPGVAAVVGPRDQLPPPAPAVVVARNDGGARYAVVFDTDPLAAPAIHDMRALRDRMPELMRVAGVGPARVAFGGQTALAADTVSRVIDDLKRVAVVAIVINVLLLALFMRALVAPLYLVASSVLGLLASLGLATLFFQNVLGEPNLTYYVPFAAAVLLVALGSDYNVFVAGRIWEEARRMRLREAIAVAAPQAARAVTVAGVALAASFALLAIVPLRSFREFAFVMGVGVLIDTFIVRTLLVPALTSIFGEAAWWPGRRVKGLSTTEFVGLVAGRAGLTHAQARQATEAALATLAERITPRETQVLTSQLPDDLTAAMGSSSDRAETFDADEFLRRMSEREGVAEAEAAAHARAVLLTLEETMAGDLDYVRAQLSEDYAPLFDTAPPEAPEPVSSTSSRRGP
jgi:putative drug exporter of the RND superfamily